MRKLAIVIPVLGRFEGLETSLVSLLENRPADCELLVVLNSPYDDPYNLADEVRFVQARRGAGLAESINAGVEQADAPVVHLLSVGVTVADGWTNSVLRHFKDPQVAAVSPLVLDADCRDRIVTAGVGYRLGGGVRQVGQGRTVTDWGQWAAEMQGPSLLAGFYRKSMLESLGGFDRSVGAQAAGADLALHFKAQGFRAVLDPQSKVFAAMSMATQRSGGFGESLASERMFLRHVPAGRWTAALAAHAALVAGEFCRGLPRPGAVLNLVGRSLAWTQFGPRRREQQRLVALAASAAASTIESSTGPRVPRPHAASFRAAANPTNSETSPGKA